MASGYFIFEVNDDGFSRYTGPMTPEQLQKNLLERSGESSFYDGTKLDYFQAEYEPGKILIIKGEIVVPQPVKVATSYKIP